MPLAGVGRVFYLFFPPLKKEKENKEPERTNIKKTKKKMVGWTRSRELLEDMRIDTLPYSRLSERVLVLREIKYYFRAVIGVISLLRKFTPR